MDKGLETILSKVCVCAGLITLGVVGVRQYESWNLRKEGAKKTAEVIRKIEEEQNQKVADSFEKQMQQVPSRKGGSLMLKVADSDGKAKCRVSLSKLTNRGYDLIDQEIINGFGTFPMKEEGEYLCNITYLEVYGGDRILAPKREFRFTSRENKGVGKDFYFEKSELEVDIINKQSRQQTTEVNVFREDKNGSIQFTRTNSRDGSRHTKNYKQVHWESISGGKKITINTEPGLHIVELLCPESGKNSRSTVQLRDGGSMNVRKYFYHWGYSSKKY